MSTSFIKSFGDTSLHTVRPDGAFKRETKKSFVVYAVINAPQVHTHLRFFFDDAHDILINWSLERCEEKATVFRQVRAVATDRQIESKERTLMMRESKLRREVNHKENLSRKKFPHACFVKFRGDAFFYECDNFLVKLKISKALKMQVAWFSFLLCYL